jgi:hypothetical protein
VGVRLYQKGLKKLEERDRYCRQLREEDERKKGEELIFHPRLVTKQSAALT